MIYVFTFLALFVGSGSPVFADDILDTAVHDLDHDAEQNLIVMNRKLLLETRQLLSIYREIAVSPESANMDERVSSLTQQFAKNYANWSIDVALESYGSKSVRAETQEQFVYDFFAVLAEFAPMESARVAAKFKETMVTALEKISAAQQLQAAKFQMQRNARRWRLSKLDGAVSVGVALTIFQAFQHFTGGADFVAYLSSLSGFVASAGLLRGPLREAPSREQTAYAIAAQVNTHIYEKVCENLLNLSAPAAAGENIHSIN